MPMTMLKLTDLRLDGGTQPRDRINEAVVERYVEAMAAGLWDFARSAAPIVVFHDGSDHWLADGFHRLAAAQTAGLAEVEVEVRQGTLREARWFSFSVNAEHGYARDKDDVARVLKAIFADDKWRAIPLREIARHTRIPVMTVQRHYEKHVVPSVPLGQTAKPAVRTVTRGGRTYEMDTGAIGKAKPAPANGRAGDEALNAEFDPQAPPPPAPPADPVSTGGRGWPAYPTVKGYFDHRRPHLPSRADVEAMTPKQRDALLRAAEASASLGHQLSAPARLLAAGGRVTGTHQQQPPLPAAPDRPGRLHSEENRWTNMTIRYASCRN